MNTEHYYDQPLPLSIRDVSPGEGFTRLEGTSPRGLPEGVHTGGTWLSPDGAEVWKPCDGRPYPNAEAHFPTREVECLTLMAGQVGFPQNWRTVEQNGRRWLVRQKAERIGIWLFPEPDHARQVELAIRALNQAGWSISDPITAAVDPQGQLFIVDLSAAWPSYMKSPSRFDDWNWIQRWLDEYGFVNVSALRRAGHRALLDARMMERKAGGIPGEHVYAAPTIAAAVQACIAIPGAKMTETGVGKPGSLREPPKPPAWVKRWVFTLEPVEQELQEVLKITWAWSPIRS